MKIRKYARFSALIIKMSQHFVVSGPFYEN